MGLLTRIEEKISVPLEIFHNCKGFQPVDLNRLAVRCMERGSRKGINKVYAPNHFQVLLSSADYQELKPFIPTIQEEIISELERLITERNYLLAGKLVVNVENDPELPQGQPQVTARMHGSEEPVSVVSIIPEMYNEPPTVLIMPEDVKDAEVVDCQRLEWNSADATRDSPQNKEAVFAFQDMDIWQQAHLLTVNLLKKIGDFANDPLQDDLRKLLISIPAGLAEFYMMDIPEHEQLKQISQVERSVSKVCYYLILLSDLGYDDFSEYHSGFLAVSETVRLLNLGIGKFPAKT